MRKAYNWWDDPKNKEAVDRISWWAKEENFETYPFPLSVTRDGDRWTACTNDETKKLIGEGLFGVASGDTKEEAISKVFTLIKISHLYCEESMRKYQRWVPFRCGGWNKMGSCWFAIFGIHFYFRYGKNMKGGFYIPFTKLNVSISSDWDSYKEWKKKYKTSL